MTTEPRFPKNLREIPDPWWDEALDGQTHQVDLSHFPYAVILPFKQACYRQAAMRQRKVTVYHPEWHCIYIRAFPATGTKPVIETRYAVETPWPDLGPDVPMVLFPKARWEKIPAHIADGLPEEALLFLKSAGFAIEGPPAPQVTAPAEPTMEELVAAELAWLKEKCTCGSEDMRFHPADCGAWF